MNKLVVITLIAASISAVVCIIAFIVTTISDISYSNTYSKICGERKYFVRSKTTKHEVKSKMDIVKARLIDSIFVFFMFTVITVVAYYMKY